MIIGDKTEFAVELKFIPDRPNEGYGKIWIENEFIGTSEDIIFLDSYLLGLLDSFRKASPLHDNLYPIAAEELINKFRSGLYMPSDKYLASGSTFTDDFSIWCYSKDGDIYILWQLLQEGLFNDLKGYSKEVFIKKVSCNLLDEVIKKVESTLEEQ